MMAFVAAFYSAPVDRLQFTKKELTTKNMEDLQSLVTLMSAESSWKLYRNALHNANPPLIPYMGVYIQDLTFIDEAPDKIGHLINFAKRKLVCNVIQEIITYQQTQYNLVPIPKIAALLMKLPTVKDDKELFELSLLREPRQQKQQ
jgi:hypothetical protein